ncbi:futalosine hydrolase [Sphingobacterium haloxyli]|uniref:Futalosine hydrolase n=1 Tax=Sphingobacterium haloxyli TaxID=2100533 RepID=A0A2S9J112_9SPHI|nr:futalosine hydrolase [Sphingobacterium haloxyli]PRD46462.1 futalosine hydrolase [Sphingobacterium haloxyli]
MSILVVAATIEEIKPSLSFLKEKRIPYLITGVGMVATTYALATHLQRHKVDLLVHVGIGGALDSSAPLGEVYQIYTDEIFGLGAEDNGTFLSIEELGFGKRVYTEKLPINIQLPNIQKARGITVNSVHGSEASILRLHQQYQKPLIESMEGAAAFFVAEQQNICCLQFRSVSNYIEPRNRNAWEIGLAIKNLNDFLQHLLRLIN